MGCSYPDRQRTSAVVFRSLQLGRLFQAKSISTASRFLTNETLKNATPTSLIDEFGPDWPHVEHEILDSYVGSDAQSIFDIDSEKQYVTSLLGLMAQFSRSNVSISSADTAENPVINPNWLSDPRDQDIAVAGFKTARQIFATESMKPVAVSE